MAHRLHLTEVMPNQECALTGVPRAIVEDRPRRVEDRLTCRSAAMKRFVRELVHVAELEVPLLLVGESGAGKTRIAHAAHVVSAHGGESLTVVRCPATPEEGLLRALDRGAGTLLLDEIGALPLGLQDEIEHRFETAWRHGSNPGPRLIATSVDELLSDERARGFRGDLYYRFVPLVVPPLRHRLADVSVLFAELAGGYARRYRRSFPAVDAGVLQRMQAYPWPGNVRELEELARRSVLVGAVESPPEMIEHLVPEAAVDIGDRRRQALRALSRGEPVQLKAVRRAVVRSVERSLLARALAAANGNRYEAARQLGISTKTLGYKARALGFEPTP